MQKVFKKCLALTLCLILMGVAFTGCQPAGEGEISSFPRNETLYFNGLQWGPATNFNPFGGNPGNFVVSYQPLARVLIYETLFVYNQLDNKLYPLLGTEYTWAENVLTVKLNPDAHWSDGEKVTAADVAYTYELTNKYALNSSSIWAYLESVEAVDDTTVTLTGKSGDAFNPKMIEESISAQYIVPKHVWTKYEEEAGNDGGALLAIPNMDPIASGPYKVFKCDDTMISAIRDDNYWGQAESMYGKLPAPKYIVHNLFKDNPAGDAALKAGEVDVSQQFISQVWKFWENDNLPISTYLSEAPYYVAGSIPSLIMNFSKPGLDDVAVRKAIAMSVDYDTVGQNAMSGYTAPMSPSLMIPTDTEQALLDQSKLKDLQWSYNVEEANKILDAAGWAKGADGIREKNGVKLSFKVECPGGWTDWNAALEVVAQGGKAIGIDIQTYFPEMSVWINDRDTGSFDMIMHIYPGVGVASPWARARQTMLSGVPAVGEAAYFNYGRYSNPRADELIALLALETDSAKLKEYWTELNQIYLTDIPTIGLMYRPALFYTVNESVWTGFPHQGDGSNIPPNICMDGYGIQALYVISAKA